MFLAEKRDFCVVGIYLLSGFIDRSYVDAVKPCIEVICMSNCVACDCFVFFEIWIKISRCLFDYGDQFERLICAWCKNCIAENRCWDENWQAFETDKAIFFWSWNVCATSWADLQSERSVTAGTTIWQSAIAVLKSMRTYVTWVPRPSMHTTLLSGLDLVPPKFLGLRRIIILLFASAAKITVSISSTKDQSFSSSENPALRMLLKADIFLLPSLLLGWLLNHSVQSICCNMLLWKIFRFYLDLNTGRLFDSIADRMKAEWSSKFHCCLRKSLNNKQKVCSGLLAHLLLGLRLIKSLLGVPSTKPSSTPKDLGSPHQRYPSVAPQRGHNAPKSDATDFL